MGDIINGKDPKAGTHVKRPSKVRNIWADRVLPLFLGSLIPPLVQLADKYLDNSKQVRLLEIEKNVQENTDKNEQMERKVQFLNEAWLGSQIQLRTQNLELTTTKEEVKALKLGCDDYCKTKGKK